MKNLKTLLNMSSSSSDLSLFFPFNNDHFSEITCYPQPLFSNPLHQIIQNVPDLLFMDMEGDINVSTPPAEEKVWTSFNVVYIRKMKRTYSTGDLQIMEEGNLKVGRCNEEERKEKIQRYRMKKKQRNFNKTIKYECRKTLADSRPRIRGRFVPADFPFEY